MSSDSKPSGTLSMVLRLVSPLAKKHITPDNIEKIFNALTEPYEYPGERTMIVVSRKGDGSIVGSVVSVDDDNRITAQYAQQPVADLITNFLNSQT